MLWGGVPGVSLTFPVSLLILSAGEVQAFYEDLSGRQYVNEVFNFSVDKLYDLLFTNSPFQRDFMEQRRFSGPSLPGLVPPTPSLSVHSPFLSSQVPSFSRLPDGPGRPLSGLTRCRSSSGPCRLLFPAPLRLYAHPRCPDPRCRAPKARRRTGSTRAHRLVESSSYHVLSARAVHQAHYTVSFSPPVCPVCQDRDPDGTSEDAETQTIIRRPRSCS